MLSTIKSLLHRWTTPERPLSIKSGWYYQSDSDRYGGASTWSGEQVSESTAQNLSVVWACQRIISESVAFLPLALMQSRGNGKYPATTHPMHSALHDEPNPYMTAMEFRETETAHLVMGGNCYARILRRAETGTAFELYPIKPSQVTIDQDKQGRTVHAIAGDRTYTTERGRPIDILHVRGLGSDGLRGYSVLEVARQSFGIALAGEKYAGSFFRGGGRAPYILKLGQKFSNDEDRKKFRDDWNRVYSDPRQAPILEPWLTYEKIGLSSSDAQLLESRQFSIPEVCRWFLISPHLVGDLSRATFSNIEHLALQFVKMTLTAWLVRWEQELRRCVLTPDEKESGYYFRHNVNGLLRGDFASRMAGYASALQNGHSNIDEVRDLEDLNPLPGGAGQAYHIQLNMATVPGTGQPMITEQGILAKVSASGGNINA